MTTNQPNQADNFPQDVDVAVLEQDIKAGTPCDPLACPVALACRRVTAFQGAQIKVGVMSVKVTPDVQGEADQADAVVYDLGHAGENFVSAFDWKRDVQPVVVQLTRQAEREISPDIEAEVGAEDEDFSEPTEV